MDLTLPITRLSLSVGKLLPAIIFPDSLCSSWEPGKTLDPTDKGLKWTDLFFEVDFLSLAPPSDFQIVEISRKLRGSLLPFHIFGFLLSHWEPTNHFFQDKEERIILGLTVNRALSMLQSQLCSPHPFCRYKFYPQCFIMWLYMGKCLERLHKHEADEINMIQHDTWT